MGSKRVVIVGGGAAGLAAAVAAARDGAQVSVLEERKRVGKSILVTGNGRCNLTNTRVGPNAYNAPDFVAPVLSRLGYAQIKDFFRNLGLCVREEDGGKVYPLSNSATTVTDVLYNACLRLGVEIVCRFRARGIEKEGEDAAVVSEAGERVLADAVIIASGGGSRLLETCGHELVPFQPVLCSLATDTGPIRGLSGVRARARVSAYHGGDRLRASGAVTQNREVNKPFASESGEVLFRDYGLSGIVIFDLSRYVEPGDYLSLHLHPATDEVEAVHHLEGRVERLGIEGKPFSYGDLLRGMFHSRINDALIAYAGLKPRDQVDANRLDDLAHACVDFRLQVKGIGDAKHAQVTRGGAKLDQFDPTALESLVVPGVYAAGECLDVDGRCGGFNLHWAWASGIAAARAAVGKGR
jgi:predicted Rossmann fold flavoprotein